MRKHISIFAVLMFALPVAAQSLAPLPAHPEGVAWPTGGWEQGEMPAEAGALVQPLIDKAMASEKGEPLGETRAIVIIYRGQLVAETYRDGFTKDTKQMSWSMAKSITSSLVGRAVHLGLIESIDDPMPSPYPDGDPRRDITWRQWLNMTEGLNNHELSEAPMGENLFIQMMFGDGKHDIAQYAVDKIVPETTPGEVWKYSTAGYHMIGWALADVKTSAPTIIAGCKLPIEIEQCRQAWKKRGETVIAQLPDSEFLEVVSTHHNKRILKSRFRHLSRPLSLNVQPEFDSAGTYLGGSNIWASAHDYAKFGYLYLRDGLWDGERLMPEGWVDFSRTKTPAENNNTYGAGFWITTYGEEPTIEQAVKSAPWDSFHAGGSEGQTIWIVPSRDLVIVRLGQMENTIENWNLLFEWNQEISRAFPEVTASP